jgi:uncharacterized membrane protein YdbT with pleckstrin-like domain
MAATGYLKQLLGDKEEVVFVTRQHWFVLAAEILSETVLTIALLVLVTLIWTLWVPDPNVGFGYLLLLFPLVSLTRDVMIWLNRQYIVTNRRVIHISGVLHKDVTDSSLEKVNDVKMEQSALGRLFDYGDIEILTASELGVNEFKFIRQPIRFKQAMLNAKENMGRSMSTASVRPPGPGTSIPDLIAQLDQLRKVGVLTEEEFQKKKTELMAKL